MRSFRSEPFLWIHLAGLAALPLFLQLCWIALGIGDPLLPVGVELLLVALIGIAPILWMQLVRPFYIFSVLAIAIKPEQLTSEQLRILSLFKTPLSRLVAVAGALLMLLKLWVLYQTAPLVATVTPFSSSGRLVGLFLAGIALLASNLFWQVPLSVMRVLLTGKAEAAATVPYPTPKIFPDFTVPGWRVNQILPTMEEESLNVEK